MLNAQNLHATLQRRVIATLIAWGTAAGILGAAKIAAAALLP